MIKSTKKLKIFLLSILILFAINQIVLTVRDKDVWPFSSYTVFESVEPEQIKLARILLTENNGTTQNEKLSAMLPLEYFRVTRLFSLVYLSSNQELKERFSQLVLNRINSNPWRGFDEMEAAPKPVSGSGFAGFELYVDTYDLSQFTSSNEFHPYKTEKIYSFTLNKERGRQ